MFQKLLLEILEHVRGFDKDGSLLLEVGVVFPAPRIVSPLVHKPRNRNCKLKESVNPSCSVTVIRTAAR